MTHTVVSVAYGDPKFTVGLHRLVARLGELGEVIKQWDNCWPSGTLLHTPYSFKIYALEEAAKDFDMLLWCDASIVPLRPLAPIWKRIEHDGYWFSRNYNYTNGEFTSDAALTIMGQTRDEAMVVPHIVATSFGLDMSQNVAREWFAEWKRLLLAGAFENGGSSDPRFRGHRHDQSAGSFVCWKMGLTLTVSPDCFAEAEYGVSDKTILAACRG
jgi:hypothetical protein